MTSLMPHSAISSWSGYVYQGKVALYHSLSLIADNTFPSGFELQLDSTDDFAIYSNGTLETAHQVKARSNTLRNAYLTALSKSASLSGDRTKDTKRYFHVSVPLDDSTDHVEGDVIVSFYKYGDDFFCPLLNIEKLTKNKFEKIAELNKQEIDERAIEYIYCRLSEVITRKVIEIHSINQIDETDINSAAYSNRISSEQIKAILFDSSLASELTVAMANIRKLFADNLEIYIHGREDDYSEEQFLRLKLMFHHIYQLKDEELAKFCYSIQPSESILSIRNQDVQVYSDLICDFIKDPVLNGMPHYKDRDGDFYLPTAISSLDSKRRVEAFVVLLKRAISNNNKLASLLYEYKNLIGAVSETIPLNHSITSPGQDSQFDDIGSDYYKNITKQLAVNVIPMSLAEKKII